VPLEDFFLTLESTSFALAVAESQWLFPSLETIHVLALAVVVGSIAMVDLRLLGFSSSRVSVTRLSRDTLPFTWAAFAIAVLSGGALFVSNATTYIQAWPMLIKLGLIVVAGANMLLFHHFVYRSVDSWDHGNAPTAAKIAGGLSLIFWFAVVALGRWIAFV
jgi:hypothetical protein